MMATTHTLGENFPVTPVSKEKDIMAATGPKKKSTGADDGFQKVCAKRKNVVSDYF